MATPPKDLSKLSLADFRSLYSGTKLKDLPGQKNGPVSGGTIRYSRRTPTTLDPLSPGASVLSSYQFAHNQLLQFKVQDFVKAGIGVSSQAIATNRLQVAASGTSDGEVPRWYATGDQGLLDSNGMLFLRDR